MPYVIRRPARHIDESARENVLFGRRKLFTTVAAAALLGAPLVVDSPVSAAPPEHPSVETAAAASCIGGAWKYDKPAGHSVAPIGNGYYVTTNRCADIQVKPNQNTQIGLCYLKDRNPERKVCKDLVTVKTGRWTVLGTGFENGAYFWFRFPNTGAHKTGLVAG